MQTAVRLQFIWQDYLQCDQWAVNNKQEKNKWDKKSCSSVLLNTSPRNLNWLTSPKQSSVPRDFFLNLELKLLFDHHLKTKNVRDLYHKSSENLYLRFLFDNNFSLLWKKRDPTVNILVCTNIIRCCF